MMEQVCDKNFLSGWIAHELNTRLENSLGDIDEDAHLGFAKFMISPYANETLGDLFKIHWKSSVHSLICNLERPRS